MGTMTINGRIEPLPDDPDALLIDVVRGALNLTGTKLVCGAGVCGACTVLLDGVPVVSCLMPARAAADRSVTTVEGIGAARLHPVQKAFMAHDALQCGFCTPGFHRRGGGVSRPLAGGCGNGRTVARGNRRGAFGASVPLRRL